MFTSFLHHFCRAPRQSLPSLAWSTNFLTLKPLLYLCHWTIPPAIPQCLKMIHLHPIKNINGRENHVATRKAWMDSLWPAEHMNVNSSRQMHRVDKFVEPNIAHRTIVTICNHLFYICTVWVSSGIECIICWIFFNIDISTYFLRQGGETASYKDNDDLNN